MKDEENTQLTAKIEKDQNEFLKQQKKIKLNMVS